MIPAPCESAGLRITQPIGGRTTHLEEVIAGDVETLTAPVFGRAVELQRAESAGIR